jgi:1-acyl-sn-glycerol-3-phosphate acyltransferase
MIFQRFAKLILRLVLMNWLTPCKISGLEHAPRSGRLIVMMNHLHGLDPILVVTAMPRDVRIMSKIENLRLPFLGLIVKWFGSFPIRRGEADIQAMRSALQSLACEEALLMAPEGTRSKSGGLQEGRDGMALVAARANAPILPVVISGDEQFQRNLKRLRRTSVQITIGAPFRFGNYGERPSRAQLSEMTQEAMYRMATLLPEAYRGVYSDLSKASNKYIVEM